MRTDPVYYYAHVYNSQTLMPSPRPVDPEPSWEQVSTLPHKPAVLRSAAVMARSLGSTMTSSQMTAVSCPLPPMEDNPVTQQTMSSTPQGQSRTVTCDHDVVESFHNMSVIREPPLPLPTSISPSHTLGSTCEAQELDYV